MRMEPTMDSIKHNRAGKLAASMHRKASAPTEPIVLQQHTPGPWTAVTQTHDIKGRELDFPESVVQINQIPGGVVARMTMQVEHKANARLIAAAPEMLEALRLLMKAEDMQNGARGGCTMGAISSAIDAARLAITKATGSKE